MRVALLVEQGTPLVVEDVTPIDPRPNEVLVRVTASGVCHSDIHVQSGMVEFPTPSILGHEGAGIVEAVGRDVTTLKVGDRIIGSFNPSCGHCWYCHHDLANLCDNTREVMAAPHAHRHDDAAIVAMTGLGTFAEAMTINERSAVKIETDLPDEQLALIGCGVTTGVGAALNAARVTPGSSVAVVGCGGVGQAAIQGARIAGAARVIAVDPVAFKRETALVLGATDTVDPSSVNAVEVVRELTGGRGADFSIDAIGHAETIVAAVEMTRKAGTTAIVGMSGAQATLAGLAALDIVRTEKRIVGSMYGSSQVRRDFQRYVDLVENGKLDVGSMVSRRISLDEVNDAFRAMESGEVIRSVIV